MKKYVSTILINTLLIQLVGCYSQKAITYNEFCNLENVEEAFILTTENRSIKLTTDSLKNNYVKWNATEDSIMVWSTRTMYEKNFSRAVSDTIKLSPSEIDKVYVDEFDGTKTFFAIIIPLAIIVVAGAFLVDKIKFSGSIFKNKHL